MALSRDDSSRLSRTSGRSRTSGSGRGFSSRHSGGGRVGTGGSFSTGSRRSTGGAAKVAGASQYQPVQNTGPAQTFGGGGESSGGGGYSAAVAAPAPVAAPGPAPMKDVDWFNQDSIYRASAGRALTDLTSQLAQILADRDEGYRQLDNNRGELTRGRQEDLTGLGNDFAGRGLLGSGLYAQADDDVQADYTRQNSALDANANRLAQSFGSRGNTVNLKGLDYNNPAQLSSIWGLLGSMGMGAGNNFNSSLSRARAESAQRATGPLIQTTTW